MEQPPQAVRGSRGDARALLLYEPLHGLRAGTATTGVFPGANDAKFVSHCQAFFLEQLRVQRPALVLTLGVHVPPVIGVLAGAGTVGSGAWAEASGHSWTSADWSDIPRCGGFSDYDCCADSSESAACQPETPAVWCRYRSRCRTGDAAGRAARCCKCEVMHQLLCGWDFCGVRQLTKTWKSEFNDDLHWNLLTFGENGCDRQFAQCERQESVPFQT